MDEDEKIVSDIATAITDLSHLGKIKITGDKLRLVEDEDDEYPPEEGFTDENEDKGDEDKEGKEGEDKEGEDKEGEDKEGEDKEPGEDEDKEQDKDKKGKKDKSESESESESEDDEGESKEEKKERKEKEKKEKKDKKDKKEKEEKEDKDKEESESDDKGEDEDGAGKGDQKQKAVTIRQAITEIIEAYEKIHIGTLETFVNEYISTGAFGTWTNTTPLTPKDKETFDFVIESLLRRRTITIDADKVISLAEEKETPEEDDEEKSGESKVQQRKEMMTNIVLQILSEQGKEGLAGLKERVAVALQALDGGQ
jgi:hypothetical protein